MKKLFIFLIVLVLGLPVFTFAETPEENPLLPDTLMSGITQGTGTHFEVTDSEYLNIVLDSSETIALRLESVPEMVTMHIESALGATSTQITISRFQPLTTYYKYEDDYHNEVAFTTDENGSYNWTQDLSQLHLVFIQPRKSTKFIKDDATGGDCYLIGIWNSATKTCTLTTDVYESIQIDSDYITLDGNGHVVTGTDTAYGVYLYGRTGVTVKNLNIRRFTFGISLWSSNNNTLTENIILSTRYGIYLEFLCNNNTITNNIVNLNKVYGIILSWYSNNNIIRGNTALNNQYGIGLYAMSDNNTLAENTVSMHSFRIIFSDSSNNTFIDNMVSNNIWGIAIVSSVLRPTSNNNAIYSNNFIDNTNQAWVREGTGNIFNLEKPTGGNYWSNFDTPAEGCYDANNDGFCDDPYYFYGGVDYLPWAKQSGWEVPVDTISPTTTVTLSGTLGNNDWYISNVQVTLTAVDNEGGSGVQKTEYSFDGTTWNTYSAPFTITNEGTTTVYYKSTDNAGNVETTKSMTVKIDKTPPEITITGVSDGATYLLCAVPTPGYEVTDATSGVATSSATLTGGNANGVGTFTYKVTATDMVSRPPLIVPISGK